MAQKTSAQIDTASSWEALGLDLRLQQAIRDMKWAAPSLVQSTAIPLALEGKDIVACAQTGSGKTASFLLPILHQLLSEKKAPTKTKALVIVPTTELAKQTYTFTKDLTKYCELNVAYVASDKEKEAQAAELKQTPAILIGTPTHIVAHLGTSIFLDGVASIVVDEADLVLSFGYAEHVEKLSESLPQCQGYLMSATINPDVNQLKGLLLHNPAILRLKEKAVARAKLKQYFVSVENIEEKYLYLYCLIKLKLVKGKCLIFANTGREAMSIKMFLDKFGFGRVLILNPQLPQRSRLGALEEFNRGKAGLLVCTDDHVMTEAEIRRAQVKDAIVSDITKDLMDDEGDDMEDIDDDNEQSGESDSGSDDDSSDEEAPKEEQEEQEEETVFKVPSAPQKSPGKPAKKTREQKREEKEEQFERDAAFGVARGIDFKDVAVVINWELPRSTQAYTHRVGRTARAGQPGTAISLVSRLELVPLNYIMNDQEAKGMKVEEYELPPGALNSFRYRVMSSFGKKIGKKKFKRMQQLMMATEIVKEDKLKSHFEQFPEDLSALKRTQWKPRNKRYAHLKYVPSYLKDEVDVRKDDFITQESAETALLTKKQKRKINRAKKRKNDYNIWGEGSMGKRKRSKRGRNPLFTYTSDGDQVSFMGPPVHKNKQIYKGKKTGMTFIDDKEKREQKYRQQRNARRNT